MNQLRAAQPDHDFAKACVVVAGPTLVTLVPMAAAPALAAMATRFAGTFGGDGALFAQLVMTIPAVMLVLAAPVLGWLCERVGRRRVLLASLLLFAVSGSAALVTPDATTLIISRLLLGIAGGGMLTVCLLLAGDFPEGGPRERLLGFAVAGASMLAALALIGGGSLVDHLGWRAPFALYLLGIPAWLLAWRGVRDHRPPRPAHSGVFAPVSGLWTLYLTAVAFSIGMFMPSIQGPFLSQSVGVTSAATQGTIAAACAVIAALSSASFGWLVRWIRPRGLFVVIAAFFGVGCLVMAISHDALRIGVGSAVMGVAAGLVEATSATIILGRVPEHMRSRALGLLLSAIFLGQFLNPLAVDPLRQALGIKGSFVAVGVAFIALAIVLLVGFVRGSPSSADSRPARV